MNISIKKAFTLIEIIVSITILSIIIISVVTVYITASDISLKSEINRLMQENIKNAVEIIAEDIRINGAIWVANEIPDTNCTTLWLEEWFYEKWTKLCTESGIEYYLAKQNNLWDWVRADNVYCKELKNHCIIVRKIAHGGSLDPMTNSFVSVKFLQFSVTLEPVSKVTINMVMQPSIKKWVRVDLIKENELIFQTTVSNRPF